MENYLGSQGYFIYNQTYINPIGLIAILMGGTYIFCCRRERLLPAFLFTVILIPLAQRVVIFDLDFTLMRIFILVGWLRLTLRKEIMPVKINSIDLLIILWGIFRILNYTILWQTLDAFVNRLGSLYDTFGLYFLFRLTIKDFQDLDRIFRMLAYICFILLIFVGIELIFQRNLFISLGGVPEITDVRDGRLRCQGPFSHPIMLGTFCASLVPIFLFFRRQRDGRRIVFLAGGAAAVMITLATGSSGPVLTLVAGLIGLGFWPFRGTMRIIKWGILIAVVSLHIVMKAPVWALLGRVKVFGASTGYHRYLLFNEFISRIEEWWLWGIKSTSEWGKGLDDLTNHYVRIGADGGLISIILFVGIIVLCFRVVGRSISFYSANLNMQKIIWGFGASLFAHMVSFMGVSYFDQINVLWFLLLASFSFHADIIKNKSLLKNMGLLPNEWVKMSSKSFKTPVPQGG